MDLEHAVASGRWGVAAELRSRLSAGEGPAAAEASLQLGFHRLFIERDGDGAADAFRSAIRARAEPFSRSARMALAQVLLRQGKPQQAAFELRKAAEVADDLLSVQSLALLSTALRALGRAAEAEALAERRKAALARIAPSGGVEGAIAWAWLGFEHKYDGQRRPARTAFESALGCAALPAAERAAVEAAIADL